jgi:hypothetical protein
MSWLNIGALWLLSLSALIAIVYFLRLRAPAYRVSALFLWRHPEERSHSSLRLLWSRIGLLLLQLAALTLMVTALADPVVYAPGMGARLMALIIDGSASMRAQSNHQTRYEQAVKQALDLLDQNPVAQAVIIQAESHSRLLASLDDSRAQIVAALGASQPTFEGDADEGELLQLLRSQADLTRFERVIFLTDHAPSVNVSELGWEVRVVADDQSLEHVALTDFSVRPQPSGSGVDLFVKVHNGTRVSQQIPLEITLGDRSIISQTSTLDAGQEAAHSFSYDGPLEVTVRSHFTATLDVPTSDAFAYDNQRYALPPEAQPLTVLWIGPTNPFIEGALRALGTASITERDRWPEEGTSQYDLIVAYKTSLPQEANGHLLLLDASYPPIITLGAEQPAGPWQVTATPLLDAVQPEEIVIGKMRVTQLAREGQTLLRAGEWPALFVYEAPGVRLVALPFDPDLENSNLLLTVDFPILMTHITHWLAPFRERSAALTSGNELSLQELGSRPIVVLGPEGQSCVYGSSDRTCGRVEEPGFYTVKAGSLQEEFAVNTPASESEELGNGQALAGTPISSVQPMLSGNALLRTTHPLWPFLLLAGLILLVIELSAFDPSMPFFFWSKPRGSL